MFCCIKCGMTFERLAKGKKDRGERFGEECYEDTYYCPLCGSSDFDEGHTCDKCGKFFSDQNDIVATDSGHYICTGGCIEASCTPDIALEYIESNDLMDGFISYILPLDYLKLIITGDKNSIVINNLQAKAEEFCMDDKRHFAEKAL